jgi:amino acid transporter
VGSGLIAISQFANDLSPEFKEFNNRWTSERVLVRWQKWGEPAVEELKVAIGPSRLMSFGAGVLLLVLLYRRITILGRLTVTFWLGVMGVIAWILVVGWVRFDPGVAFSAPEQDPTPAALIGGVGAAMILAMYSYLGYFNVCYIGDEVRDPARTIPRAILLSSVLVCVLFVGLHLAMLGTVAWREVPVEGDAAKTFSLAAEFMRRAFGGWGATAATLVSILLIWSCTGSIFAALLGYSRIPYGAARYGHFFSALGQVHPVHRIPHVSLLLVGGLTLFWSFFDLGSVINALITTRILEQFIGQVFAVMLLRRRRPEQFRPYQMWLYPLPCLLALVGWSYLYLAAGLPFIILGLATLAAGALAFLVWSRRTGGWPFEPASAPNSA